VTTVPPVELNTADTLLFAFIVRVQVIAVPEHAPPHEEKVYPDCGVAVRVTVVPETYGSEQSPLQIMPAGEEKMVPPIGCVAVSVYVVGVGFVFVAVRSALHCAVVPPFDPAHDQVYVEVFVVTPDAVPVVQRFEVGAVLKVWPCAVPHVPFRGVAVSATYTVTDARAVLPSAYVATASRTWVPGVYPQQDWLMHQFPVRERPSAASVKNVPPGHEANVG
jgi:hypothetical protein